MATKQLKFSEKEVIVMGLSMTYAVCVGLFAVIRFVQQDWVIGFVDAALSLIGLAIFIQVLIFRQADIPALMVSLVSVLGTIVTIYLKGPDQVYWAYPSAALVFYLLPTRQALIIWSVSVIIILMLLINLPPIKLTAITLTIIVTSFFCHLFSSVMHSHQEKLRAMANEDTLTQVGNRRAFNQDIEKINPDSSEHSLILLDLDKFKLVNDYLGHKAGDVVLCKAAQLIQQSLLNQGSLYRIGGDEFAILCLNKEFENAYKLACTVHSRFKDSQTSQEHGVTLSMAVGQKQSDESLDEWIGRLDSALYKAKKSGRNQIVKAIRY